MIKLSVVLPAYNEEGRNLVKTLEKVEGFLSSQDYESEVIVVNDGSKDQTVKVVNDWINRQSKIKFKLVSYETNQGKGYAVKTGMLAAKGEWRLFMDADSSTDILEIEKLFDFQAQSSKLKTQSYQVIIGSRYLRKDSIKEKQPLFRRLISRGGNLLVKILLGLKLTDTQCGFKLFSAKAVEEVFPLQTVNRWGFDMEILAIAKKKGYKIKEVPVDWYNAGDSRVSTKMTFATLKELWAIRKRMGKI